MNTNTKTITTQTQRLIDGEPQEQTWSYPVDVFKEMDFYDVLEELDLEKSYYAFFLNGKELQRQDLDCYIEDGDTLAVLEIPELPVGFLGLSKFWLAVANMALAMVLSYVANALFGPEMSDQEDYSQSASYNLNSSQNTTAIGEYVGVGYGTFRLFPKLVAQPFVCYRNNEMYVQQQMAIGQGNYDIKNVFIGSTSVKHDDNIKIQKFTAKTAPYNHVNINKPKGIDTQWSTEIVNKIDNIQNVPVHFEHTPTGKPKIEMPLWKVDPKADLSINFTSPGVFWTDYKQGRLPWNVVVIIGFYDTNKTLIREAEHNIRSADTKVWDRVRLTSRQSKGAEYIKIRKKVKEKEANEWAGATDFQEDITIEAVYEMFQSQPSLYGGTSLINVQMKATGTVSGSNKLQLEVQRTNASKFSTLKDCVQDIYSDTTYGAKLPASDLVFDSIAMHTPMNCYFDRQRTVLDSMREVLKPQMFHIVPTGSQLHMKPDKAQTVPVQKYNQENTTSMKLVYAFDQEHKDSVEVEYRDNEWKSKQTRYPKNGIDPVVVKTKGLENDAQADKYAKYLYLNRKRQKTISFGTDIQGRIPQFLDLIHVEDPVLKDNLFIVTKATRSGETTQIEALEYDASVYS